jgi:hypothetical protein
LVQLSVRLEHRLFDSVRRAAQNARGDARRLKRSLERIVLEDEAFDSEREVISSSVESWFEIELMTSSPTFWAKEAVLREHLEHRAGQSAAALTPYLPANASRLARDLTVHLVPGFLKCYGSAEDSQIFGLRAEADPEEALLFLIHVYYHEVSSLFYTETSRRAAAGPSTAELFKHWLLLLIQNEGLANYVVLEPLIKLRDAGHPLYYFTYAGSVRDEGQTAKAMTLCRKILSSIDEDNFHALSGRIADLLKNSRLPVINLVGIHLAEAVAATFGEREMFSVAEREPQEFFRLYSETGDEFRECLFGPRLELAPLFGLEPGAARARPEAFK